MQLPCLLTETLKCFNRYGPFLNEVKYVWKRHAVGGESPWDDCWCWNSFLNWYDKFSNEHILSFATKNKSQLVQLGSFMWFSLSVHRFSLSVSKRFNLDFLCQFITFGGSESKPPFFVDGVGLWKQTVKIVALSRVPLLSIFEISTTGYLYVYFIHIISYHMRYYFVHIYNTFTQMRVVHNLYMCHVYMLLIKRPDHILLHAISLVASTTKASMYQMRVGFSKNGSQKNLGEVELSRPNRLIQRTTESLCWIEAISLVCWFLGILLQFDEFCHISVPKLSLNFEGKPFWR